MTQTPMTIKMINHAQGTRTPALPMTSCGTAFVITLIVGAGVTGTSGSGSSVILASNIRVTQQAMPVSFTDGV